MSDPWAPDPAREWRTAPAWAGGRAPLPAPPRRGGGVLRALLVVLVVALAVWFGARWIAPKVLHVAPPPGVEEQRLPIGTPPLGAPTDGPYSFMQTQDDGATPVAYDPCRPIHYVVRPDGAPAGGDALIATAVDRISTATGLRFVADGPTTEEPASDRAPYQPDRYGERWAPVLVAWSTPAETPELTGDVAGSAGSSSLVSGGTAFYVTGSLVLDAPSIGELLGSANGTAVAEGIVTHEMAHVVGLGHVDDPHSLMNPTAALTQTSLANGDLAGLARLGTGPCAPHL